MNLFKDEKSIGLRSYNPYSATSTGYPNRCYPYSVFDKMSAREKERLPRSLRQFICILTGNDPWGGIKKSSY